MPLRKGKSKETIAYNIREMIKSGHTYKQALAAVLNNAGIKRSKKRQEE